MIQRIPRRYRLLSVTKISVKMLNGRSWQSSKIGWISPNITFDVESHLIQFLFCKEANVCDAGAASQTQNFCLTFRRLHVLPIPGWCHSCFLPLNRNIALACVLWWKGHVLTLTQWLLGQTPAHPPQRTWYFENLKGSWYFLLMDSLPVGWCWIIFGKVYQTFSQCDTLQSEDRNTVMSPGYLRCPSFSA